MLRSNVQAFFRADHDRLRRLFTDYERRKATDPVGARRALREFTAGLRRHIRWEEEILFPVFEAKSGITNGGPTSVMRLEHVDIRRHLASIEAGAARGNGDGEEEARLAELLASHDGKEEGVLYPSIDVLVSQAELGEIFRRIDAIGAEQDQHAWVV